MTLSLRILAVLTLCTALSFNPRAAKPKALFKVGGPATLTAGTGAASGLPRCGESFTVLGIETSCDDTAVAVVRSDGTVLGEAIARQDEISEKWGGVVPGLAREAHEGAVDRMVELALERAFGPGATAAAVDAVAATVGPGLEICLRVGATAGRGLALHHGKPFLGVHHLEAHCLVARAPALMRVGPAAAATPGAPGGVADAAVGFPFLALVVSGGHCLLLRVRGVGAFEVLGGTLDDALGEAYDKCARQLNLPVGGGGGPAVERAAARARGGRRRSPPLPVPMRGRPGLDFSFSGLKNALKLAHADLRRERGLPMGAPVEAAPAAAAAAAEAEAEAAEMAAHHIRGFTSDEAAAAERFGGSPLPEADVADLCEAFEDAAIAPLEDRVGRAMRLENEGAWRGSDGGGLNEAAVEGAGAETEGALPACRTLVVVGGVAANQEVGRRLRELCARGGHRPPRSTRERAALEATPAWTLHVPAPAVCTDNGIMVAWAAVERLALGISDDPRESWVRPRWPIGELIPKVSRS